MRIYKYPMTDDAAEFKMPKGAKVVHCDNQNQYITLWALVDDKQPLESRYFAFFPTGGDVEGEYVGTVLISGGAFVWHVFEQPSI